MGKKNKKIIEINGEAKSKAKGKKKSITLPNESIQSKRWKIVRIRWFVRITKMRDMYLFCFQHVIETLWE